jgi:hypothetical protein
VLTMCRYSDFVVNEIGVYGEVVVLTETKYENPAAQNQKKEKTQTTDEVHRLYIRLYLLTNNRLLHRHLNPPLTLHHFKNSSPPRQYQTLYPSTQQKAPPQQKSKPRH